MLLSSQSRLCMDNRAFCVKQSLFVMDHVISEGDPTPSNIGHFRVLQGLCIKTRLSAQPLIWK